MPRWASQLGQAGPGGRTAASVCTRAARNIPSREQECLLPAARKLSEATAAGQCSPPAVAATGRPTAASPHRETDGRTNKQTSRQVDGLWTETA